MGARGRGGRPSENWEIESLGGVLKILLERRANPENGGGGGGVI